MQPVGRSPWTRDTGHLAVVSLGNGFSHLGVRVGPFTHLCIKHPPQVSMDSMVITSPLESFGAITSSPVTDPPIIGLRRQWGHHLGPPDGQCRLGWG